MAKGRWPWDDNRALEMFRQGCTYTDISRAFGGGLHWKTVRDNLRDLRINEMEQRQKLTEGQLTAIKASNELTVARYPFSDWVFPSARDVVVTLARAGSTVSEIEQKIGIKADTIITMLAKARELGFIA